MPFDSDGDYGFDEPMDWTEVPNFGSLTGSGGDGVSDVTENREGNFSIRSGRFHDPDTGEFELGGPPPDFDPSVDRYRAVDGKFKSRSADLFDEKPEVALDSLEPRG